MTLRYCILRLLGYQTLEEVLQDRKAGKISGIGPKERKQFQALTRAGFPLNLRYPKSRQIYKAKFDAEVHATIRFMEPFTGGEPTTIPQDTKVIISEITDKRPTTIYFTPLDKSMENQIVSEHYRKTLLTTAIPYPPPPWIS
jgi:hypothetical protein